MYDTYKWHIRRFEPALAVVGGLIELRMIIFDFQMSILIHLCSECKVPLITIYNHMFLTPHFRLHRLLPLQIEFLSFEPLLLCFWAKIWSFFGKNNTFSPLTCKSYLFLVKSFQIGQLCFIRPHESLLISFMLLGGLTVVHLSS